MYDIYKSLTRPTQHRVGAMAQLVELPGQRSHVLGPRAVIGRGETCEIRVDDPMVSAAHAEIVRDDNGSYQVRDLGSRRGTFVGNRKITEARLKHGDELMIGVVRMRFEEAGTPATADEQELIRLRAVVELTRQVGVEHDLQRVLERVLATCFKVLRADRGAIVVYQPNSKAPYMTVTKSRDGDEDDFAVSSALIGQVMMNHEAYLRTEVDSDVVLQRSASLSSQGVRSVMAVPLHYQAAETEWLGLIEVDSSATVNVFGPKELELLEAIAGPAALAIKNAMLVRQVQTVTGEEWRRLERVVRDLPLGVVVLDESRTCTMVNKWITARGDELGEIRPGIIVETIAGIPCETLVAANIRTQITSPDTERTFSIATNITADGRESVIVINDITEERERQNQIAHRDRVALIGQLAGGIAHDFNNLLHVIMTYANMLEESLHGDSRDDAHQITHAASSAAELTKQLLSFSRRELVKPRVVDVSRVVNGMEKLLHRTIGGQIQLITSIAPRIPRVLIDTAQLEQVLMNLVVNARDAMPNGGKVELRVSTTDVDADRANQRAIAPGRYVMIEVADSGAGIAPNVLARIFEPYFSTKARGKGTGLGLATVHGIVQHAGGDILVESHVGAGSTFRVLLPATELAGEVSREVPIFDIAGGTVLVVDDDDSVRKVTERLLRSSGFTVITATSGPDALDVARAHRGGIDLLLTDIVMPGMSGRDLARELGGLRPTMKILFMSGYHQHSPLAEEQFLTKPFHRAELLEKVRGLLAEPSATAS
jgi:signal transduction histidine kinase